MGKKMVSEAVNPPMRFGLKGSIAVLILYFVAVQAGLDVVDQMLRPLVYMYQEYMK